MLVNINGKIGNRDEAKISVLDHCFMYGDGVFETMRTYNGIIYRFDDHINRLLISADEIHFRLPWQKDYLMAQIQETFKSSNLKEARIRVTVTRGEGQSVNSIVLKPNFVIIVEQFEKLLPVIYIDGVKVITVNMTRQFPRAKSCNYLTNVISRIKAREFLAHEAIICSGDDVKEGAISNIFMFRNGKLITPREGIIKGITRDSLIKLAKKYYVVEERSVSKQDLYSCRECFLTSSVQEIVPIVKIDNVIIGNGKVGEVSKKLMLEFKKMLSNS